ncbi:hypothetical protein HDE_11474 [Halotydeus destructor]|nr:hypothetical protein HDE_11474 [Halotydeus destructor]
MFGILLNLIQTDGVVEKPPKRVERFYDLINEPEFRDIHVVMFTAFHFYNYLLTAVKGTMAHRLYTRMAKTDHCSYSVSVEHCNFLQIQLADSASVVSHLMFGKSDFVKNRKALLVDKSYYDTGFSKCLCIFIPEMLVNARGSKDFLVADYGTLFYSKAVNKHLMKHMNFRLQSLVEADIIRKILQQMVDTLDAQAPTDDKFKRFRCMHGIADEKANEAPPALDMKKLRKTLMACFSLLSFSLIVLAIEKCPLRF